ncbi:sensor histidine kinase [Frankia sp. AgB1.9]|uniref:sensor histidine kinase n=1 Tax=unclassified Frankia TaxID=2632575 RepID=UPI0019315751|nr:MULTISPECIES: sensor histidine kinase [unclassified Frankia]MBL7488142.1 sensor histidine kinase [Frankia sp. AgW1.1]MBL7552854.1 sensor histidine kinase [Frankia sp. AgB1.9]MBL7620145.1 sensor histidine kinase [Frankia sp. AgB1.8]
MIDAVPRPAVADGPAAVATTRGDGGHDRYGVPALALAGAVLGAVVLRLAASGRDAGTTSTLFSGVVGGLYLVTGVVAHLRRPSRLGSRMVAIGVAWFAEDLAVSDYPLPHTVGLFFRCVASACLVHILLAFPEGRLLTRTGRAVTAVVYVFVLVVVPLGVPFYRSVTPNLLLVADFSRPQDVVIDCVQVTVALVVAALLVRRWLVATPPARRVLAPVYGVGLVGSVASLLHPELPGSSGLLVNEVAHLATLALPLAFLAGALRVRLGRTAVADLLVRLPQVAASELPDLLARALGDPTLRVAYPHPDGAGSVGGYVDAAGRLVEPRPGEGLTPVRRGSRVVAVLLHDPALRADRHVLQAVAAVAALELDNQRLTAEVRAQLAEVRASRVRIVAAADEQRRGIERDLHDGAQQQLVTAALVLRLARDRLGPAPPDPELDALLGRATDGLAAAVAELRELARGIHPAVLTEAGLMPALRTLAARSAYPVLIVDGPALPPLPDGVAATAYFVAAEAVTNAAKHAGANQVHVHVRVSGNRLLVTVADDGVGGADLAAGTGLLGLRDRVAAIEGTLVVDSSPGAGTSVHADLPLEGP